MPLSYGSSLRPRSLLGSQATTGQSSHKRASLPSAHTSLTWTSIVTRPTTFPISRVTLHRRTDIDVSNEAGPKSETYIAIGPKDPRARSVMIGFLRSD